VGFVVASVVEPVVGVVLAAGTSSRLGRSKQLEPVAGKPLIVHTLERVLRSDLDRVIVVAGAGEDMVRGAIGGLPVEVVSNPQFGSGQASSVIAGVRQAETIGADAVVFLLADQPGISPWAINRLIEARRSSGAPVGMARYGDRPSHPVLFGKEVFPDLLLITGDMGGREIVLRHRDELVLVDGGRETVPADLDEEADLAEVARDVRRPD
jgi:molybdenum cofactor cytidylyltransferase